MAVLDSGGYAGLVRPGWGETMTLENWLRDSSPAADLLLDDEDLPGFDDADFDDEDEDEDDDLEDQYDSEDSDGDDSDFDDDEDDED